MVVTERKQDASERPFAKSAGIKVERVTRSPDAAPGLFAGWSASSRLWYLMKNTMFPAFLCAF